MYVPTKCKYTASVDQFLHGTRSKEVDFPLQNQCFKPGMHDALLDIMQQRNALTCLINFKLLYFRGDQFTVFKDKILIQQYYGLLQWTHPCSINVPIGSWYCQTLIPASYATARDICVIPQNPLSQDYSNDAGSSLRSCDDVYVQGF
jgi:hypothetical protein